MKRSPMPPRSKPMSRGTSTFKRATCQIGQVGKSADKPKRKQMRSKQRAVSEDEKKLWDRLASEIGCIACMKDGLFNPQVSIHHIDGRTKPNCHKLVLPLCAGHHQDGTGATGLIAVHPWKARFEKTYGLQLDLLAECLALLEEPWKSRG